MTRDEIEKEWEMTTSPPPEGIVVQTVISDSKGVRNHARLKKSGNLWFMEDGSMYVYYTPTHWKRI